MDAKQLPQAAFNATADGQRALCATATSNAVLMMMNTKIRTMGGTAWDDKALAQMLANVSLSYRDALRDDLLSDYNALCAVKASRVSFL